MSSHVTIILVRGNMSSDVTILLVRSNMSSHDTSIILVRGNMSSHVTIILVTCIRSITCKPTLIDMTLTVSLAFLDIRL